MDDSTCKSCVHCDDSGHQATNGAHVGTCRRLPPYPVVLDNRVRFKQPTVLIDYDWCGEWSRNDDI